MNVIAIEQSAYEQLVARLDEVTRKVKLLVAKSKDNPFEKWLDNQDVCQLLNLSPRSLQNYRDTGKIAFSMLDRKVYYKRTDIQQFLDSQLLKDYNYGWNFNKTQREHRCNDGSGKLSHHGS